VTTIYLTNSGNTLQTDTYYIEIESAKLEFSNQANIKTVLEKAKAPKKQNTAAETLFIDLQQRAKVVTVTGHIDKKSRKASLGGATSPMQDVSVIRKILTYMWELGGTQKLYIGYGDGYYNRANSGTENEYFTGLIEKIDFTEEPGEHIDRASDSDSYPSAVKEKANSYVVVFSFRIGVSRAG